MQLFIDNMKIFLITILLSILSFAVNADILEETIKISPTEFKTSPLVKKNESFKFVILNNEKINKSFSDYIPKDRKVKTSKKVTNQKVEKILETTSNQKFSRLKVFETGFDDLVLQIEEQIISCSGLLLDIDTSIRKEYSKNIKNGDDINDYALLLTRVLEKEQPYIIEMFFVQGQSDNLSISFSIRSPKNSRKKFKVRMPEKIVYNEDFVPTSNGFEKKIVKTKIIPGLEWLGIHAGNIICNKIASF